MKNLLLYFKPLSPNKFWELQIFHYISLLPIELVFRLFSEIYYFKISVIFIFFNLNLSWSKKTDHAGLRLELSILGFYFSSNIYDCRHWDEENNTWCK